MKQILLDTNGLVSFLTDRNLEQQEKAEKLFNSALQGESQLILHQIAVVEMVYVLKAQRDPLRRLDGRFRSYSVPTLWVLNEGGC